MNVVDHNCPTCGAVLNFNPNTQNWICNYCKAKYTLDMLDDNSVVTVKSFCGDIPGEYVAPIENMTEEDLYNSAGLL